MIQKIIRVGNSYAVTIPKSFLNRPEFSGKLTVDVVTFPQEGKMIVYFGERKNEKNESQDYLTLEFKRFLDDFYQKYGPILEELKRRRS